MTDSKVKCNLFTFFIVTVFMARLGVKWHQRRKTLTPAFHFNILNQFCGILGEHSQLLVEILEKTVGEPIDLVPVISEFTLHSICDTAMGTRLNDETTGIGKQYKDAIYKLGNIFVERTTKVLLHWDFLFNLLPLGRNQKKLLNIVHGFTDRVIENRKEYLDKNGINVQSYLEDNSNSVFMPSKNERKIAFLDLLISAENDGLIDSIGIREEVDTFMFEGHDTTASGLTLCLMLLASHKDIQDKIFVELNNILGDSMQPATTEDLSRMRYLECCIKESLRLYPPVHFIGRTLSETVKLSGYTVPAGVYCHIHIYDLHRRENLYKDPLVFDPERFLPENCLGRHPYAYIPFSAGPRNCIGQRFAMMEMKTALSAVLRRFELCPVTRPTDLQFTADLVLRNTGPVYVKFVKRSQ